MNVVDLTVTGLVVVNAILGAFRGFALQAFRLASIVLAIWLAKTLAGPFADGVQPHLDWPRQQLVALGWITIGGAVYLVMIGIGHYAKNALQRLRMGGADRALGTLLGALKGLLIAAIGLHLLTQVISFGSPVIPEALRAEMQGSRAFEFYLDAIWPISETWVRQMREMMQNSSQPK